MKVLIFGAAGQVGRALLKEAPSDVRCVGLDRSALDITDFAAVDERLAAEMPDLLINTAAYTSVDQAESDQKAAFSINAEAVGILAKASRRRDISLVHLSTDFVFDGEKSCPYPPDAATNPLSIYGLTKLEGERRAGEKALVVRTAWVYAPTGNNFVRTMLRLMRERNEIRVIADQTGTPTYAPALASAIWSMAGAGIQGIYHYTDAGVASWYDFAVAIQEEALIEGLVHKPVPIIPIATEDYPTAARRPAYSVLDCRRTYATIGRVAPHWRENLRHMMKEIKVNG